MKTYPSSARSLPRRAHVPAFPDPWSPSSPTTIKSERAQNGLSFLKRPGLLQSQLTRPGLIDRLPEPGSDSTRQGLVQPRVFNHSPVDFSSQHVNRSSTGTPSERRTVLNPGALHCQEYRGVSLPTAGPLHLAGKMKIRKQRKETVTPTRPVTTPVHEDRSLPAKQLLYNDGWTMAEIGRAAGTSITTVHNCLSGLTDNARVREAIKKLYPKVSSEYLFGSGDQA